MCGGYGGYRRRSVPIASDRTAASNLGQPCRSPQLIRTAANNVPIPWLLGRAEKHEIPTMRESAGIRLLQVRIVCGVATAPLLSGDVMATHAAGAIPPTSSSRSAHVLRAASGFPALRR
jgi:hypothetical protein